MSRQFTVPTIDRLDECDFLRILERVKERRDALCAGMRQLRDEEIKRLEAGGNQAEDWSALRVSSSFIPDHVRNSWFFGSCWHLPRLPSQTRCNGS